MKWASQPSHHLLHRHYHLTSDDITEAESENMVLRLSKQLSALLQPSDQNLPERVSHLEHELEQTTATADLYRAELIELRGRLGMDVSDLVGISKPSTAGSSLPISGASSLGLNRGREMETAQTTPCGSYGQTTGPPPPSLASSFADQVSALPVRCRSS